MGLKTKAKHKHTKRRCKKMTVSRRDNIYSEVDDDMERAVMLSKEAYMQEVATRYMVGMFDLSDDLKELIAAKHSLIPYVAFRTLRDREMRTGGNIDNSDDNKKRMQNLWKQCSMDDRESLSQRYSRS